MEALWSPSEQLLEHSQMARFAAKQGCADFKELHKWSTEHFKEFWNGWLLESGIVYEGSPDSVYVAPLTRDFFGGHWFPDLRLSYSENLIDRMASIPLVALDEGGRRETLRAEEVRRRVRGLQLFMKAQGLKKGDRVAACLPHGIEAVIGLLAANSLGLVWSSCSPDFGLQAMVDRFGQIEPKLLLACSEYSYAGKRFDVRAKTEALRLKLPSLNKVLFSAPLGQDSDFLKTCESFDDAKEPEFLRLPFAHPLYILFSSGTTGAPKCLVHSVGGTLLQHSKELALHCDLKSGEKILYYTTCGWMMWNWVVSSLFCEATLYCFDGSPAHPQPDSLWKLILREGIDVFGTSAKFLASNRVQGVSLGESLKKAPLRLVLSTGSPLLSQDFDYFYQSLAREKPVQLASISGGTDIVSCFMLGNPLSPVYSGEIQGPGLGMKIAAYSEAGEAVLDEKGELVCQQPFPSMPTGFLNDPNHEKFRKAYFERYPGVWHHGDYITIRESGAVMVHGRSDATLNPGGVRIGTAEIYRQVETVSEVVDSLVVGYAFEGDEKVVLFVKLRDNLKLDSALEMKIKRTIRQGASPRHVPALIFQIIDLPYTLSGKKVELAVKQILQGVEPKNIEALANPQALDFFRALRPKLPTLAKKV